MYNVAYLFKKNRTWVLLTSFLFFRNSMEKIIERYMRHPRPAENGISETENVEVLLN